MKKIGKIKDACMVIAGQSPKGTSYNDNGEGLEFHQGKKAFGENLIEHSYVWTTEITKIAEPGDILMSVRAPVGPTNLTDRKICIGRGLAAIRCNENVISQYILYALRNIESKIIGNNGAVFNSINKKQIEDLPLPVLDLTEQQSIVSYLDAAFAKIDAMKANAEKALGEAKALFQASLKDLLTPKKGWEEKKLKEVVVSITDGDHQPPPKSNDGIPFITISNIDKNSNKIVFEDTFYVPQSYFYALKKDRIPQNGDVLYTVTGSFGIPVLIDFQKKFCFQRHIALIRPNLGLLSPTYLFYWILSSYATSQAEDTATGTAQRTVSLNSLRNFTIHVPSLTEQQTIVSTLDTLKSKVDRLQTNYEKISAECDALKQAILRQVFE